MPLINTSVPNLIQGVSQQPDATRFAGQCEEQENALSSVADGLKKRPNTRHISRLLTSAIDSNSFVHFINRSDSEKYVLIHDGTHLRAYNMINGQQQTINGSNSYAVSGTYLASATARASLKALTIADSTFILNTEQAVGLGSTKSPAVAKEALLFIKQGDYKKKYGFKVNVTASGNSGVPAVLTFNSRLSTSYYMSERAYIHSITVPSGGSGSGFAKDDIINIPLPSTSTVNTYDDDDEDFTYNTTVTIYTQPTMRVTSVGSNGVITGASVENAGSFIYRENRHQGFGLGSGPFSEGNSSYPSAGSKSLTVPTTNSTTITTDGTTNSVTLKKVFQSGDSAGTGASVNTSTSAILTGVNALTSTTNSHAGTTDNIEFYFESEDHHESNLLILSVVQSNGLDVVEDFTITPIDDLAGGGMGVVYKEVNSIVDLPLVAKNGFEVKVAGDAELNQDDYYVRFETTGGVDIGQGSWVECVAPNLLLNYDANTLPIELISDGTGFTLRTMKFADRSAGDVNSNPLASFVAQGIDNLFFFKNRLGFLCGENVVMSESGLGVLDSTGQLNYNFSRTTVTTLLDSDPIDVSVASSRVTNLKAAKGFQENLILFSENGQFVLKGGDVLTPKTVSIIPITNFSFEDQVDPFPLGSYIYFPFTRGNFTGMREFTVNASTDNYDSTEVTEHVPAYIPSNIIDMAGTTTEDLLALLSSDEKGSLYIYNYFWNNNQKVLSAWSKFTFSGDIRGIDFIDSTLYMVMTDDQSNTHLVSVPFEAGLKDIDHTGASSDFLTLLDRRVRAKVTSGTDVIQFEKPDGTYSSLHADLPYTYYNGDIPSGGAALSEVFVDSTGTTHALKYNGSGNNGNIPLLSAGNATTDLYGYVGLSYTMKYKFSTQVFKASTGKSASPTNASAMHVRNGTMFFDDTHTFDVKVTPENRTTTTNTFLADDLPEATLLGAVKFAEGNFRFPVYSKAKHANVLIENSSPFDSKFSSAEFESFVHPRSQRYG